jgi:hypothetical protein
MSLSEDSARVSPATVSPTLSVDIDDYRFTLISRTIGDGNVYMYDSRNGFLEDRNKVVIESEKIETREKQRFYAYTSVSELGIWRYCIANRTGHLQKFDNYIQATLLDIRLQSFINEHFRSLPFAETKDTHTRPQLKDSTVNPNGAISCLSDPDTFTRVSGRILNRWIPIFPPNLLRIEDKSNFLRSNYHLLPDSFERKIEYQVSLDNYTANVEIHEITATRKTELPQGPQSLLPEAIVFQIGKFNLHVEEHNIHREGYYIFNINLPSNRINEFGLYTNYISGTCQNPFSKAVYKTEDDYISKALNYKEQPTADNYKQIDQSSAEIENIHSQHYFFTAYKNDTIFPIEEIRRFGGGRRNKKRNTKRKNKRRKNKTRLKK